MRQLLLLLSLCLVLVKCKPQQQSYTKLTADQIRHLQSKGFGPTVASVQFRPTQAYVDEDIEDEEYDDAEPEATQDRQPTIATQNYPIPIRTTAAKATYVTAKPERRPQQYHQQQQPQNYKRGQVEENKLDEKEEEEPDRLSLLLPQSKFTCQGKNTGYYADEDLSCEVFHYCQDNAKHSWICPEGFTFHQVHLICMPPGGDNICEKSSSYHFVNEYLYKPLNLDEYQQKPNITLKYSDRYYPDSYRPRYEDDDEERYERPNHHQHSVRVVQQQPIARTVASTYRPQSQSAIGQVFRSPEEINISLQQRRPQYTTSKYNSNDY